MILQTGGEEQSSVNIVAMWLQSSVAARGHVRRRRLVAAKKPLTQASLDSGM